MYQFQGHQCKYRVTRSLWSFTILYQRHRFLTRLWEHGPDSSSYVARSLPLFFSSLPSRPTYCRRGGQLTLQREPA